MYRAALIVTVVGAIFLIIAIALPFGFPLFFDSQISKKLIIQPNSDSMKNFREIPIPLYYQIYFLNLTNAEDVVNGVKPVVNQVGPYTYRQIRKREDISWDEERGTVIFKLKKFYYFEPGQSIGAETDEITTINPVFITLASKLSADHVPDAAKSIAQLWFYRFSVKPFITHSVGELLFNGYDEPLLGELYKLTKDPKHEMAKFGFLMSKNGTADGETEIFSGQLGMHNYQHIHKWHGKTTLDFWKEDRCNMINGTEGAQFARPIDTSQPLYFFSAELCRSLQAYFEKNVMLGPVSLKRFVIPASVFKRIPENDCFCATNFTCKDGLIELSPCRKGSPVVVSAPHFYHGSLEDQTAVEGLNPNKEEHETFLDIEPTTGVSMRIAKRIQISMPLRKYGNLPSLSSVPEIIMPIFWVNESIEVPLNRAEKLYVTLTLPVTVVNYGSWVLLGLGLLLILIALLLTYLTYVKNSDLKKRRQDDSDRKLHGNDTTLLEKKLYQVS